MKNVLTEKEIIDGTRILAPFNGWIPLDWEDELYVKKGNTCLLSDMKYSGSYDWLIPVWIEFRNITDVDKRIENVRLIHIHQSRIEKALLRSEEASPVEAFRALVSAVKWFNGIENNESHSQLNKII